MPFFICPNCKDRSVDNDGRQGLLRQAVSCERCGFGFLFEILDDYYPPPTAGLVACDRDSRILAAGRGVEKCLACVVGEGEHRCLVGCPAFAGHAHDGLAVIPVELLDLGTRRSR